MSTPPLVVLGDSHTRGAGASRPEAAYPRVLAGLLDLPLVQLGFGGAGVVHPGPRRVLRRIGPLGRHAHRVPRRRSLLVLQVPAHDRAYPEERVTAALDEVVGQLGGGPGLLVGPLWAADRRELLPALREVAAGVAARHGLEHVGADGWITPELVGPDGAHFSDAGHRVVAEALADEVLRRGLLPGRPAAH